MKEQKLVASGGEAFGICRAATIGGIGGVAGRERLAATIGGIGGVAGRERLAVALGKGAEGVRVLLFPYGFPGRQDLG